MNGYSYGQRHCSVFTSVTKIYFFNKSAQNTLEHTCTIVKHYNHKSFATTKIYSDTISFFVAFFLVQCSFHKNFLHAQKQTLMKASMSPTAGMKSGINGRRRYSSSMF